MKMNMRKPKVTVLAASHAPSRGIRLARNVVVGRKRPDMVNARIATDPAKQCTALYKGWKRCDSWALPDSDKCVVHTVYPMHPTKTTRSGRGRY